MPEQKKIADLFRYHRRVSFELFPPKSPKGLKQIYQTIARLSRLNPDFFSVTYGAGGSTAEKSLEIASAISNLAEVTCVAHFTCVGMNREQVKALLDQMADHGIGNVLALRGDPPKGETQFKAAAGGFAHADELVAFIKQNSEVGILVAGYPEGHVENPDKEADFNHLVRKVKNGADGIVTQAFFDNQHLYRFRDKLTQAGVTVPLIAGIFPISQAKQFDRMFELSGATAPAELKEILAKYGDDPVAMEQAGTEFATRQVEDLLKNGVNAFHFYTMNRADQTLQILTELQRHFPQLHFP